MKKNMFLIKNNKGGIGKTFITANLASYLAELEIEDRKAKVLILTDDAQNNILTYSSFEHNIEDLECDLNYCLENNVLKTIKIRDNIDFIPFQKKILTDYALYVMESWLENAKNQYDFILVDSNPSLENFKFLVFSDYWIAPMELTELSVNSLSEMLNYISPAKLIAIQPNKKRDTNTQNVVLNYLKNDLVILLKELGADDFIINKEIKLSSVYEDMQTTKELVPNLSSKNQKSVEELNYVFFNLLETILKKSNFEELKYKIPKELLLKNKKSILKNREIETIEEFEEIYSNIL